MFPMSNRPIVSVIIPTKNSQNTLENCLQSIKEQSYKNIELVVVDNFSTDETPNISKRHADKFFQKGPERCTQRNYGVSKASGKYIAVLDSDMYLSKNVIQECVEQIESNPNIEGVIIPEKSIGIGFWARCKTLERSFYVGVPYMEAARFFKSLTFKKLGGYDEKLVSGEDWDLSQRVEQVGKIDRIQSYIFHDEQKISLIKTIRKKFYYAGKFGAYTAKSNKNANTKRQVSIVGRYFLFFSHPVKLFRNPVVGVGMLFMKTCEFGFGGLGYLFKR